MLPLATHRLQAVAQAASGLCQIRARLQESARCKITGSWVASAIPARLPTDGTGIFTDVTGILTNVTGILTDATTGIRTPADAVRFVVEL